MVTRPPDALEIGGVDLTLAETYMGGVPHAAFARLRAEAPIAWHPEPDGGPGFWVLTRHADTLTVSRDSATFSSWAGGMMIADSPPEQLDQMRLMMIIMDPPEHTKLRLLVNKGFTPRHVQRLHDRISEMAREIVDGVAPHGRCDFVTDVSGELPSMVIAELMGIPLADGRRLYDLTEQMHTGDHREGVDPQAEMFAYAQEVATAKRAEPADDIASALLAAEVDGRRLTDIEFNLFFMLLINAGGDTDEEPGRQRDARPARAARSARAAQSPTRAVAHRGRGAVAVRPAGADVPPHRHPRRRAGRHDDLRGRQGGDVLPGGQP